MDDPTHGPRVEKAQRDIAEILRVLEIDTGHVVKKLDVVCDGAYQKEQDGTFRTGVVVRIGMFRIPGTFWSACAK